MVDGAGVLSMFCVMFRGRVSSAGLYDETLLVVVSDNGADPQYCGSNFPYRGKKGSLFEGGVLVPAFITGALVPEDLQVSRLLSFSTTRGRALAGWLAGRAPLRPILMCSLRRRQAGRQVSLWADPGVCGPWRFSACSCPR